MNDMTVKTPWHLWVVGVVAVLWHAYGCYDFTMTQTQGVTYLQAYGMTEAQIAYFTAMPPWTHVAWGVGVWGGMLGSILLLLRMKWAFHVFVLAFIGFIAGLVYSYGLSNGSELMGSSGTIMNVVIGVGCLFFIWYAWTMTKRGVLR